MCNWPFGQLTFERILTDRKTHTIYTRYMYENAYLGENPINLYAGLSDDLEFRLEPRGLF